MDPIPTALLKNSLPELLPYITFVINDSLLSGTVPCCYKNALVKPLIKKPGLDFNVLKNFRPVSNLPFLSKILEKVILKRLLLHLENNDLNEIFQSAYKKCHSTETALLKVYNDILCDLDKKHVTLQSLLDLSAAFDTLDHGILLKRLELSFGIKGSALAWFESYLVNRKQSVQINQSFSDSSLLIYGIPQGSVLGPILFSLYTTPLSNIFCKYDMKYHLYADDSQLYKNSLYSDLNSVIRQTELCIEDTKVWMDSNKLKLNDDKTELILFKNKFQIKDHVDMSLSINGCDIVTSCKVKNLGIIFDEDLSLTPHVNSVYKSIIFQLSKIASIRKYITVDISLSINGCDIVTSSKVKNLGVIFDEDLSLTPHVNYVYKSIIFQLSKIASIRKYINEDIAKTLVTSLILSRLDYCNSLFCNMTNENVEKLQLLQNHAARLIFGAKKRDHITPLLMKLHWLPIYYRINYKIALLCFKCLNKTAPIYLQNLIQIYKPRRSLRSSTDNSILFKPVMNYKTYGEKSFSFYGPYVWNSLPAHLRNCDNINIFKKNLKTHLFKQAYNL